MPANKNTCQCPTPPGGSAVCEADQLAICRVKDGNLETYCLDPPITVGVAALLGSKGVERYMNWALEKITGVTRSLSADISADDRNILAAGSYYDSKTGSITRFRIPDSVNNKISNQSPPSVTQPPPVAYG